MISDLTGLIHKVAVVMPTSNEADGIVQFLIEISNSFVDYEMSLIVVDDHSSDSTVEVLHPWWSVHSTLQPCVDF